MLTRIAVTCIANARVPLAEAVHPVKPSLPSAACLLHSFKRSGLSGEQGL
jgi:hypothetical protein